MRWNRFLISAAVCVLVGLPAFGQTTGSLNGSVTSSGARLPGVTVSITSPSLTGSRTDVTDSGGNYSFTGLPPGDYAVTFELSGLQTITKHVDVVAAQTSRLDADLQARTATGREKIAEEMTVTGSLIPRPTIEAMSPVATLDVAEIQYQGLTRLEDFLANLPQVFEAQSSIVSNGSTGTATVNLRYLGSSRTLVLVDG